MKPVPKLGPPWFPTSYLKVITGVVHVQFRGSFPALITPMKNGEVDEAAFRKFVNWQITQGSHGVVPVGTTGESPTLDPDEHKRVIEICIDEVKGRVPVIAGTGSNSTREALDFTRHASEAGADAALAASIFHDKLYSIDDVKQAVKKAGFSVRL